MLNKRRAWAPSLSPYSGESYPIQSAGNQRPMSVRLAHTRASRRFREMHADIESTRGVYVLPQCFTCPGQSTSQIHCCCTRDYLWFGDGSPSGVVGHHTRQGSTIGLLSMRNEACSLFSIVSKLILGLLSCLATWYFKACLSLGFGADGGFQINISGSLIMRNPVLRRKKNVKTTSIRSE